MKGLEQMRAKSLVRNALRSGGRVSQKLRKVDYNPEFAESIDEWRAEAKSKGLDEEVYLREQVAQSLMSKGFRESEARAEAQDQTSLSDVDVWSGPALLESRDSLMKHGFSKASATKVLEEEVGGQEPLMVDDLSVLSNPDDTRWSQGSAGLRRWASTSRTGRELSTVREPVEASPAKLEAGRIPQIERPGEASEPAPPRLDVGARAPKAVEVAPIGLGSIGVFHGLKPPPDYGPSNREKNEAYVKQGVATAAKIVASYYGGPIAGAAVQWDVSRLLEKHDPFRSETWEELGDRLNPVEHVKDPRKATRVAFDPLDVF